MIKPTFWDALGLWNGTQIIASESMVDWYVDWSGCRSPARAQRRILKGYPQRCKRVARPRTDAIRLPNGSFMLHPQAADALRRKLECDSWRC